MPATFTGARVKISELPAATAPLTGTEDVPLVQNSQTRQAEASDFLSALAGALVFSGVVTPAALAAGTTNNWAPVLTDISRIRASSAGAATVTGLAGGADGRVIIITNVGANDITLSAENALSTAANRFAMNGDALLMAGWSAMFIYDSALSRWTKLGI